uniref:Conopeptide Vi002 n=1 Tax=Conus virgo TaxID=89427 RepID=CU02_CONVR|nr:RecName: Full=Conopeptide Vi002 [Conus virgo]
LSSGATALSGVPRLTKPAGRLTTTTVAVAF